MTGAQIRQVALEIDLDYFHGPSTEQCQAMNRVYDLLKGLTIEQIKEVRSRSWKLAGNVDQMLLFEHQCDFAIEKKQSGKWK